MKIRKLKYIAAFAAIAMTMSFTTVSASAWLESELTEATTAADEEEEIEEVDEDLEPDSYLEGEEEEIMDPDDPDEPIIVETEDSNETGTTTPAETLPEATYTPMTETTMYVPESINVRVGPGTGYNIFGGLTYGDKVQVIGTSGDWYAVKFLGGTGYIKQTLLSSTPIETQPAATTAAPAPAVTDQPPAAEVVDPDPVDLDTPDTPDAPPADDEPANEQSAPPSDVQDDADNDTDSDNDNDDDNDDAAAAATDSSSGTGGLPALLIALGGALLIFFVIGLLPIIIHKIHHNKLYQY